MINEEIHTETNDMDIGRNEDDMTRIAVDVVQLRT
jgi:hypothetical protein